MVSSVATGSSRPTLITYMCTCYVEPSEAIEMEIRDSSRLSLEKTCCQDNCSAGGQNLDEMKQSV